MFFALATQIHIKTRPGTSGYEAIKPIQKSSMPRYQLIEILYSIFPFVYRGYDIPQKR